MANASFEEIVLDRPLQQIVIHGRLADFLVLLDRLVIVAFEGGQVGDLEEVFVCKPGFWRLRRGRKKKKRQKDYVRCSIITLIPLRGLFVRLECLLRIPNLDFIHLAQILLMRCRSPEVPLGDVMLDGTLEDAHRILGIRLAVDLERLCQAVRRVVGLIEVIPLDIRSLFERKTGFLVWRSFDSWGQRIRRALWFLWSIKRTQFLNSESVCGLNVEIGCILVFLCSTAEKTEASLRALKRFISLDFANDVSIGSDRECIEG